MVAAEASGDLGLDLDAYYPSADRRGGGHQGANGAMRFSLTGSEDGGMQREPAVLRMLLLEPVPLRLHGDFLRDMGLSDRERADGVTSSYKLKALGIKDFVERAAADASWLAVICANLGMAVEIEMGSSTVAGTTIPPFDSHG